MKFQNLGISNEILRVVEEAGFKEPSEIQVKAIPLIRHGKDVIGESATGSGKTLAFSIQLIEKTEKAQSVQALVLVPTRELCEQVAKEIRRFSKYKSLNIASIYGGVAYGPQIEALERAEIVVGTPGRLLDLMQKGNLRTDKITILVIDETDRLLDMGFLPDVSTIINKLPKKRQTMLFSATIDADVEAIAKKYMVNPEFVHAENKVSVELLHQYYYDLGEQSKFSLLAHLLKNETSNLVMVFCNTRRQVDVLTKNIQNQGIKATAIHGGLTQSRRNRTMSEFKSHGIRVLVASDVAARGLDIEHVSHVYNYDTPKNPDDYIHRVGRTARAGKEGMAITLLSQRDYENFSKIVRDERVKVIKKELPNFSRIFFESERQDRSFGKSFRGRVFDNNRGFSNRGRDTGSDRYGRGIRQDFGRDGERNQRGNFGDRRFGNKRRFSNRGFHRR